MATYTNLGIKQITTGDESGTWGDSTNTNFDYFDTAIVGYVSVTLASAGSSGSPNTLNVADFAASNGRNRIVEFVDAGDLGGTAYVQITPNDFEGYYFIRNGLSGNRSILLFQGTYDAARDYEIPNGKNIVVRCSGGGSTSYIYNVLENLQVGNLSVSSLTASTALALDANKNVASVTNTGTGNNVLATSPTLTTPEIGDAGAKSVVVSNWPTITSGLSSAVRVGALNINASSSADTIAIEDITDSSRGKDAKHTSFSSNPIFSPIFTGTYVMPLATGYEALGATGFVFGGISQTITAQYGFHAASSLTGATTNYGFYSNLATSGTSRYNFYAAGTAPNYFAGNTTFNTGLTLNGTTNFSALTASTALALDSSKNVVSVTNTGTGSNVLATSPTLVTPVLGTPTSGTLTNCTGLPVSTGISGFGTGVATALAVNVGSSGAFVTNGGALGTPSSGTVTNLTGTASININGTVGITTPKAARFSRSDSLLAVVNVTGTDSSATSASQAFLDDITLSASTNQYHVSYWSTPTVSATTLTNLFSFYTTGCQLGVGASVTNQYGYYVTAALTNGTSNYGFYSNLAVSGTSRYNFYAAGSAPNYFGGSTVISVTDNTNAALRVTQLGTGNALEIEDTTNPDSSPFVVDANGVLIKGRSTTVSTKVLTTAGTLDVQVHGTGAATSSMALFNYANNATFPSFFVFNKSKSGTSGTLSAVTDGDNLGLIQFNGADSDATSTFNPGAYISAQVAGAVAASSIPARLNFSTTAVGATTPVTTVQIASTGLTVTRDAAGLGYGTGSGGAVTQATSRTTGVTLNKTNGAITLVSAAGTATWQSFTVTNSTVAATDVVILSQKSGTDLYMLEVTAVAAGSFRISFATTGGTTTEQPVFNFAVIKAVAA